MKKGFPIGTPIFRIFRSRKKGRFSEFSEFSDPIKKDRILLGRWFRFFAFFVHLVHKAGRTYEANGDTNGENKNEAHGELFFWVRERIEQES